MDNREQVYRLELVRKIQERFPNTIIGGSISIFLHGVDLQRDFVDLDIISKDLSIEEFKQVIEDEFLSTGEKKLFNGSCDFDECLMTRTVDERGYPIKFDIKQVEALEFETIVRDGYRYKVAPMSVIMEAKKRYAEQGATKHEQDLEYIFRHSINRILDLPLDIPYLTKKETAESELGFPF